MTQHALFVRHNTRPGKRDEVEAVWRRHMMPAIDSNPGHEAYFYCFGETPETICAFQCYSSKAEAESFLRKPAYQAYLEAVGSLLEGPPDVQVLAVRWAKQGELSTPFPLP